MNNSASDLRDSMSLARLRRDSAGWLLDGETKGWTPATRNDYAIWLRRLQYFLEARGYDFSTDSLRRFLLALTNGEPEAGCRKKLRPHSVRHVYRVLKALCAWLVKDDILDRDPMRKLTPPIVRDDRAKALTDEELRRLMEATQRGRMPERDFAILHILADTGMRAGELCALRDSDLDLSARTAIIAYGKGGKRRTVVFGADTARAIYRYLRQEQTRVTDHVFETERGRPFTPSSLRQLVSRIGSAAGVQVHPHLFRHDAAVRMLRNGASAFHVQTLLGHSDIGTTQVYVRLAEADVINAYRSASPLDNLKKGRKTR